MTFYWKRSLSVLATLAMLISLLCVGSVWLSAAAEDITVQQTDTDGAAIQSYIAENTNLLAGLIPAVSEEGTNQAVNDVLTQWENLTDGSYTIRKSVSPTGRGSGVLRFTFTLAQRTEVSELLLVCRENNPGMYGMEYEIYVGDDSATLYDEENRAFVKAGDTYTAGGQLVSYAEDIRPVGYYVGFRMTDATNKYHIGEWGVYGTKAKSLPVVRQTNSDGAAIQSYIAENTNLLAGLTPTVSEEGTNVGVNTGDGWGVLTDGDYATRKSVFITSKGTGVLRFTFTLAQRTEVSELLLVCRDNNPGMYGMEYEIYVGDDAATLYDEENRAFVKTNNTYTAGGQLVSYAEDIRPVGYYVGFRMTDATNKYHIGEWGVYGIAAVSPLVSHGCQASTPSSDGTASLRFVFDLACDGVEYEDATHQDSNYQRQMTDATVTVNGKSYTLVDFGAIVSTQQLAELTIKQVNGSTVKQVPARKLYSVNDNGTVTYTARVVSIPQTAFERTLLGRPYVIYSDGTDEVVLYGTMIGGSVQECLAAE